jgi:cytochrome c oxidase subunit 1
VVAPPPGSDIYMIARLWSFWPILELEKGKTYRLHLTSMDYNHGFSLQPANINIQVVPGYEHVVTVTPNQSGHLLGGVQRILRHQPSHDGRPHLRQVSGETTMSSNATTYRTCPRSGLQFEANAEKLMIANAVAAVVFLLIGGILAIGVVLTRWPAVHWLEADTFYQVLTAHGIDMLIFWIIFFEIAVLYFCSSTLLSCRLATPKIAWLAFALMLIGAITNNVAVYQGGSSVMMTSYVPMMAAPSFYLGLILFAVGALIGCFVFFGTLVVAKRDKTYEGSVPLVTFGAITACIIAVFTIASGAIILIPTFLMSLGVVEGSRPAGLPHDLVGLRPLVAADQRRGAHLDLVPGGGDRLRRQADERARQPRRLPALHPVPAAGQRAPPAGRPGPVHRLEGRQHQLLHVLRGAGLDDPRPDHSRARWKWRSAKGFNKGLFEWLRKAPWGNPVFSGVFISIIGFGFLGGISGVMMGTEQLNMIIHNTIYVPGHFHATVVVGTTLSFMALTYFLIPVLFKREMIAPGLAKWQPYLFGFSMYFFCLVMMGAGTLGVSRRHWDMAFGGGAGL